MKTTVMTIALLGATLAPAAVRAQSPEPVPDRTYITNRLAEIGKVRTPEGVETLEQVTLGGVKQWISVRGQNRANPVLLMIHGGPATPMMPNRWLWQRPWEDFFTVVQWDQRGIGKNAATSDSATIFPTLSMDRIVKDAEELSELLRTRFGQRKIVLLGYSWGSMVGLELAHRRPDLFHAYVGLGQAISTADEHYNYAGVRERAMKAGNQTALRELDSIAPYPAPDGSMIPSKAFLVRKWSSVFNGGWYGVPDLGLFYRIGDWGPEYTAEDIAAHGRNVRWGGGGLFPDMMRTNFRKLNYPIEVPVVILQGRWDLYTPYQAAVDWFGTLRAPKKKMVTFERSGHFLMFEEPGKLLMTLVNEVLPLTGPPVYFSPP